MKSAQEAAVAAVADKARFSDEETDSENGASGESEEGDHPQPPPGMAFDGVCSRYGGWEF